MVDLSIKPTIPGCKQLLIRLISLIVMLIILVSLTQIMSRLDNAFVDLTIWSKWNGPTVALKQLKSMSTLLKPIVKMSRWYALNKIRMTKARME
jgi:hypothetical protein